MQLYKKVLAFAFAATVCLCGVVNSVDVSLDSPDAEFFLASSEDFSLSTNRGEHLRRFALALSNKATIKASLGPFSTVQTVFNGSIPVNATNGISSSASGDAEITAHLITHSVTRDRPYLRILFHAGKAASRVAFQNRGPICISLHAQMGQDTLMSACTPDKSGACLAHMTLPPHWWPTLWTEPSKAKAHKSVVKLSYTVLRHTAADCSGSSVPVPATFHASGRPLPPLTLSVGHGKFEEAAALDAIRILVPQRPFYPKSSILIPVFASCDDDNDVESFQIRVKLRYGLRVSRIHLTARRQWHLAFEANVKQTSALVTATRVDDDDTNVGAYCQSDEEEVFNFQIDIDDNAPSDPNAETIVWLVRTPALSGSDNNDMSNAVEEEEKFSHKLTSRLDIRKDDVQSVVLVTKSSQLINTAVLTGRQVSRSMKAFMVSQQGLVSDITLQSSCHSNDESIIKVSPSCTSVYLDGSEIRGSQNASIIVKYGSFAGHNSFVVWMPQLPLQLKLSDDKLNQIRGWRTIQSHKYTRRSSHYPPTARVGETASSAKLTWAQHRLMLQDKAAGTHMTDEEDTTCRMRYQQARVEVYTRFMSVDMDSGRETYLLGRRVQVSVSRLVASHIRVSDPHVAGWIHPHTVQGLHPGRTDVQVLSPITGKVLGSTEVRVVSDKETIIALDVRVISGLNLGIAADPEMPGVFLARTWTNEKLTSQYQEAIVDVLLKFSDASETPLSEIAESDYTLSVESLDTSVVVLAPTATVKSHVHPRIIAVGQGQGDLVQVYLQLADKCHRRRGVPLASAHGFVHATFASSESNAALDSNVLYQDAVVQRPAAHPSGANFIAPGHHSVGGAFHPGHHPGPFLRTAPASPIEVGLYAMLGVFCTALLIFVASCTVFAVKYKNRENAKQKAASPTDDNAAAALLNPAHDWVWLGRATLERSIAARHPRNSTTSTTSPSSSGHTSPGDMSDQNGNPLPAKTTGSTSPTGSGGSGTLNIRITSNPQTQHLEEIDECVLESPKKQRRRPNNNNRSRVTPRIRTNPLVVSPDCEAPPVPPHRAVPPATTPGGPMEKGMNYDQLMAYFESLKESTA